jgi:oligoendopeptidase F
MTQMTLLSKAVFILVFCIFASMNGYSQKNREEIPDQYKWNLSDIFKSDAEWRAAKDQITLQLGEVEKFKGTLTQSAGNLLKCLEYNSSIAKEATKLYIYAGMNSDLDTRDMKYTGMKQELQQLFADFGAKSAFIDPEILSVDWSVIDGFLKQDPKLDVYRIKLENLFRTKKHTLSEPEERIMALTGLISDNAYSTYNTFSNAEMPSPEVTLTNGEKISVGSSEYSIYRASPNRADREIVFNAFWDNYAKYKATYGELLNGNVKKDMFQAKARHLHSNQQYTQTIFLLMFTIRWSIT